MALAGGVIGLAAALALGTAARSQLFKLEGQDPGVLLAATRLFALVALTAGLPPAIRASRSTRCGRCATSSAPKPPSLAELSTHSKTMRGFGCLV